MALANLLEDQQILVDRLDRKILELQAQLDALKAQRADASADLSVLQEMAASRAATKGL